VYALRRKRGGNEICVWFTNSGVKGRRAWALPGAGEDGQHLIETKTRRCEITGARLLKKGGEIDRDG